MGTLGKRWKLEYRTKVDVPTYETMHSRRLPRERGRAQDFECVDCGHQAYDWSYKGGDPNELISETKKSSGMVYSTDTAYYEPRCRKCHLKFDKRDLCRNKLHSMTDPKNWYIDGVGSKNCRACRKARSEERSRRRSEMRKARQ